MTDYCVDLNFSINPLISGVSIDSLQKNNESWTLVDPNYINPELKTVLGELGLTIKIAGLFTLAEGETGPIHLDGAKISDLTKINWSYNNDHDMIWYTVKNGQVEKNIRTRNSTENLPPRRFIDYHINEVEEVYRKRVGFPSLVQAGVPHNVANYKGVRRCLTIVLYDVNGNPISMNTAKEIFSQWLVEAEGIEPF